MHTYPHMQKPNILVTNHLIPEVINALKEFSEVTEQYRPTSAELKEALNNTDILICRSATKMTREMVEYGARHNLKMISSATSGIDHIDLVAAKECGIVVTNTPFSVTVANAEFNIGMIIALSRNFLAADAMVRSGMWDQQKVLGREAHGKMLGIVGFGKIGQLTADFAHQIGMHVQAFDPYVKEELFKKHHAQNVSLEWVMATSDFVVVQVPMSEQTKGLIHKDLLRNMKKTSFLIQVSRGGVIDEDEFISVLQEGVIAGAAIDVFVNEPNIREEFKHLPNVLLSPHIACSSIETRYRAGMHALSEIKRFLKKENLKNRVA